MAGNKYVERNSTTGLFTEVASTQTSAGVGDAAKIPALDATGRLAASMMPVGIAAERVTVTAASALSQWDLVNIYDDTGTLKARKADAGTNKYAVHGFCPDAIPSGTGEVQFEGVITTTGLTPGGRIFASETPGGWTQTAVTGAGKMHQDIGFAVSTTAFFLQATPPVTLLA